MDLGVRAAISDETDEDLANGEWKHELEEDIYYVQAYTECPDEYTHFIKRRGGDEAQERCIPKGEWPEWINSDSSEREGVLST
eukprot:9206770-Pyramimonas_sp.AAC.1